jgi:hypothetical protein
MRETDHQIVWLKSLLFCVLIINYFSQDFVLYIFLCIIFSNENEMISEKECTQILNTGEEKYTNEEVKLIRDFLISLATIENDQYKQKLNKN